MSGPMPQDGPRFTSQELDDAAGIRPDELAAEMRVARELQALAASTTVRPTPSFTDDVMAAIAAEPSPVPVRAAGRAIRRASLGALLLSIRDAWRVALGRGFPAVIRAQAFALVLVVAVLGAGTAAAAAGALGLFDRSPSPAPNPSVVAPDPDASPSMVPVESSDPLPVASSLEPDVPSASTEAESEEPTGSTEPGDDNGGLDNGGSGSSGSGSSGSEDDRAGSGGEDSSSSDDHPATAQPTSTPEATSTLRPSQTPKPSDTPRPTDTPQPTDTSGAGYGSEDASPTDG